MVVAEAGAPTSSKLPQAKERLWRICEVKGAGRAIPSIEETITPLWPRVEDVVKLPFTNPLPDFSDKLI